MESDKTAALTTVTSFLATVGANGSSLKDARQYILADSFVTLSHPDGLIQSHLGEAISRVENSLQKLFDNGVSSTSEEIALPGPEVWIRDNITAVWVGYKHVVDNANVSKGVNLFSLLKTETDLAWRICGIADTQWKPDQPTPDMSSEVTPELMEPINEFFTLMRQRKWNELPTTLLPGGGMTHNAAGEPLRQVTWPEFVEGLSGVIDKIPKEVDVNEKVHDVEARVCGDLAFVWTPFVVEFNGVVKQKGVNIWSLLKKDEKWFISGCQDTGRSVGA
ncbi:hypothetical protein BDV96DRAFT_563012 [Lophiotrema nucula]|uniref:Uncharacterized protein n=1 Tax=Lophiotrema nucula TaxID=690887 RepID=A0A6A5ZTF7_9PLEO|nr:hypothetical protein BDV96DRAFT_563012 [Lophiotrema nucula]